LIVVLCPDVLLCVFQAVTSGRKVSATCVLHLKQFHVKIIKKQFDALPASKYMTPVTRTALIWCFSTPKTPTSADDPRMIRHTKAQEIDKFCIPATQ